MTLLNWTIGVAVYRLLLIALMIGIFCSPVRAQAQSADVVIQASTTRGLFLPPGTQDTLTISTRNNGPDPSGVILISSTPYLLNPVIGLVLFRLTGPLACPLNFETFTNPAGDVIEFGVIALASLQPKTSQSCEIGVFAVGSGINSYSLGLQAVAPGAMDPDFSNNRVVLPFLFARSTPVALPAVSGFAIVLGLIGICCFGARRFNGRTQTGPPASIASA